MSKESKKTKKFLTDARTKKKKGESGAKFKALRQAVQSLHKRVDALERASEK